MGELLLAREHVERAISFYEAEHHRALTSSYSGIDAAVWCRYFASQTLWELGYPDQALTRGNEAITMAQGLSHSTSLVFAQFIFCIVRQFRRDARAAQEVAESVIALAAEHGLADFLAVATSVRGWAMTAQGDEEEGIAQIQEGLAGYRATGSEAGRLYVLCLLAEACRATGRPHDGLSAVAEALAAASDSEYRNYEAETYRLKGALLLKQNGSNVEEAEICFRRAIEIARKQSAKSWELRATIAQGGSVRLTRPVERGCASPPEGAPIRADFRGFAGGSKAPYGAAKADVGAQPAPSRGVLCNS